MFRNNELHRGERIGFAIWDEEIIREEKLKENIGLSYQGENGGEKVREGRESLIYAERKQLWRRN